ncbi:HpcH/HpaI aldolase/citrate lyase family protein [Chelatococcus reniformis]|uniref:Malyl-CoA lyase n=1 Tax=Chelatococcus reniformis TaxID=1494448 RepID=A0A916XBF7_9HYPH|nr:CoA ester lyase [Chelatococcus reniformis]GGC59494.1 malyl-CoA lyase [Chelatococcus reniformis]
MTSQPMRLRRSQLAVPGSSEKMLAKAAQSAADHVFCDLEDAVAPSAKPGARHTIVEALNGLDWGRKTRCVRINDVGSEWCHEDIITVVEGARENLDTIMLPKPLRPSDVHFVDLLLNQLETKLKLTKRIGIEILIEEVEALACVEEIAKASPRVECIIFGMGDYSASQQIDMREIGGDAGYPGDIWHYPRFRICMAARAARVDPVDGPFGNFKDDAGYRREAKRALALGFVGKWAIHPAQIEPAIETFSPKAPDVARAREMAEAYAKATAEGVGSVNVGGNMVDAASIRILNNTIRRADLIGM